MYHSVAIRAQTFHVFKSGYVCLAHILNMGRAMVDFYACFPVRSPVDTHRVEAASLTTELAILSLCQGDLGEIGRSRNPLARSRLVKVCP